MADITSLKVTILPDCEDNAPNSTNNSSHGINGIHGKNPRPNSSDSNSNSNQDINSDSKQEGSQSISLPLALLEPPVAMVPPGRIIHIYKKNGMYCRVCGVLLCCVVWCDVLSYPLLSSVPQLGLSHHALSPCTLSLSHLLISL